MKKLSGSSQVTIKLNYEAYWFHERVVTALISNQLHMLVFKQVSNFVN